MKEFVKSLLLIVLTVSAIYMTSELFGRDLVQLEATEIEYEVSNLKDYIRPQNYVFSFGDLFIKSYDDVYENIEVKNAYDNIFSAFMNTTSEFNIARINKSAWDELSKRKSLTANYSFDIPLKELLLLYGTEAETDGSLDDIHITSVLLLLNRNDTIYLYDGKSDEYRRLTGSNTPLWINDVFRSVDEVKQSKDIYRSIEDRYNLLKAGLAKYNLSEENTLLTPMGKALSFSKYQTVNEISFSTGSNNQMENIAKNIFGEDLSFVKKSVYSDQSTIYMYGYGEKVLEINSDGSLEYSVNTSDSGSKQAILFKDGFDIAVDSIKKMGDIVIDSIYLADYYQIETANSIESVYAFNYTYGGIPFYSDTTVTGHMIEARFSNEELVKVKKQSKIVTDDFSSVFQSTVSFQNVLAREGNRLLIEQNFKADNPDLVIEPLDTALMASQAMEIFETVYYVNNDVIIPCWHIKISSTHYMVDLTTGLIINHYKE